MKHGFPASSISRPMLKSAGALLLTLGLLGTAACSGDDDETAAADDEAAAEDEDESAEDEASAEEDTTEDEGGDDEASADGCDLAADYPDGPVELIIPWSAGGGTDAVGRYVGEALSERLGTGVNVVNRTGGSGAVGHVAIADADPDGHTIGLATVEAAMMHWLGLTEFTVADLTGITQINGDPAGVTVNADAEWETIDDLLAAAEASPGELTGSGTGIGGIWDLARAGMLQEAGLDASAITWVPSEGAAPALQELAAGGIDASFSSLVENRAMIESGEVKALAIMADERSDTFPDVPTLKEQGIDYASGSWRGIAGPTGMPEEVVAELECYLDEIVHGDEYQQFMADTGFSIIYRNAADFDAFMADDDVEKGGLLDAVGLVE